MEQQRKAMTLEILEYWKLTEFLSQNSIPAESKENAAIRRKLEKGKPVKSTSVEVFAPFDGDAFDPEEWIAQQDPVHAAFPVVSSELAYSIGRIPRNALVAYLRRYVPEWTEGPEPAYDAQESIAWFGFRTDPSGIYVPGSFMLSPLLWAVSVWAQRDTEKTRNYSLSIGSFRNNVRARDEWMEEKHISEILPAVYELWKPWADLITPGCTESFCACRRYTTESARDADYETLPYADLGRSFVAEDLSLLENQIRDGSFGDSSLYERGVIAYILAAYHRAHSLHGKRICISPQEDPALLQKLFRAKLDVAHAPLAKWPSRFMPALMQQIAVNLATDTEHPLPIFSVNGPPGTGKTTLLKEIVAHHVVERARLLCQVQDPDDLFEKREFTRGPLDAFHHAYFKFAPYYYALTDDRIHNHSMLVTSCNNAAVENITADLPDAEGMLGGLAPDDKDAPAFAAGLQEVHTLFDGAQSGDPEQEWVEDPETGRYRREDCRDLWFSRHIQALLGDKPCWGMISAPLGKRKNIKEYCFHVIGGILNDYFRTNEAVDQHKAAFRRARKDFLDQLAVVESLAERLQSACSLLATGQRDKAAAVLAACAGEGDRPLLPDEAFLAHYRSQENAAATAAQIADPWFTAQYNREREKLFYYACRLHKAFVTGSSRMRSNLHNLLVAWGSHKDCDERMHPEDLEEAFPVLLQSLFLVTPVLSTTFASMQSLMAPVKRKGVFGVLIVDESGQAPPQMAAGGLFRCRQAIIVGDPKQIEPVVTAEADMIRRLLLSDVTKYYTDKHLSVQSMADHINPYGTMLGEGEEREWVGCPLVVHRRCLDPMYSISNALSYAGTMRQDTRPPKQEKAAHFLYEQSLWIHVSGSERGNRNHFVPAQGELVLRLLESRLAKGGALKLFIITPFTSVKNGMRDMIRKSTLYKESEVLREWMRGTSIGTVHTFQGQGTDEVIFLLGCDMHSQSAAKWVNRNIVNVAATRAKFRFYVIGDTNVWRVCDPVDKARRMMEQTDAETLLAELFPPEPEELPEPEAEAAQEADAFDARICPRCAKDLVEKEGKFGTFLSCSGFPRCRYTRGLHAPAPDLNICPDCGRPLQEKNGRNGVFMGCSGYPECGFTRPVRR